MKVANMWPAGTLALLLAGAPSWSVSGAAQAAAAQVQVDDDAVESQIEAILKKDTMLAPREIDVESDHGKITLTGAVRTAAEKERAGRLAKITGIATVVNEIEVDPNLDRSRTETAADKTKAGLNKAVDATAKGAQKAKEGVEKGLGESQKAVGKAAGKTAEALDKTGDRLSDSSVTTRVKSRFDDEASLKGSAIQVDTKDHVVTLRGTVATAAAKARAEEVAAQTEGVSRVVNDLVVSAR